MSLGQVVGNSTAANRLSAKERQGGGVNSGSILEDLPGKLAVDHPGKAQIPIGQRNRKSKHREGGNSQRDLRPAGGKPRPLPPMGFSWGASWRLRAARFRRACFSHAVERGNLLRSRVTYSPVLRSQDFGRAFLDIALRLQGNDR